MLTNTEKIDLRRFMGYEMFGSGPGGIQSHRFMHAYGMLEYRMNNMDAAEEVVARSYLDRLRLLEADLFKVRDNVDTASASVWSRNPDEDRDRNRLYSAERRRLCGFFGIPPGASIGNGMSALLVV